MKKPMVIAVVGVLVLIGLEELRRAGDLLRGVLEKREAVPPSAPGVGAH